MTSTTIPPVDQFEDLLHKMSSFCWKRLPNPKPMEYEDLMQEGRLAYAKSLTRFDPGKNAKFITYFWHVLRTTYSSILDHSMRHTRVEFRDDEDDNGDGLREVEDRQVPHRRINNLCLTGLSRSAARFVREFLYPSAGFREWEQQNYANPCHNNRVLKGRVLLFLGLERRQNSRIVAELRRKLGTAMVA